MNAEIAAFAAECREQIDAHAQALRDRAENYKGERLAVILHDRADDMTLIANAIARAGNIHRD